MEDNIYNKNEKKPSKQSINTGSYYDKANRLIIIIYAFGQFKPTVARV